MSEWLTGNQGMATFFQLLVGDVNVLAGHGLRETARKHIGSYIRHRNMTAFAEIAIHYILRLWPPSGESQGALDIPQVHHGGHLIAPLSGEWHMVILAVW
jgi:hypothetical protein